MNKPALTSAKTVLLALVIFSLNASLSLGQVVKDDKMLVGTWMGRLESNGAYLRLVFNISVTAQDTLKATLESPDQGTIILPMGNVIVTGDDMIMESKFIGGKYTGKVISEKKIDGTWTQSGMTFPLVLDRQEKPVTLIRPQQPVPPFPYQAEEVFFENKVGGLTLAGTLTLPEGDGPFPAAVLITGSGAQDRDEALMGHKPFAVIADHLTRNGIAVLRYDDRGVGKSQGTYSTATSADLATDAEAAMIYLLSRPEIAGDKIGLIGHSEGSLIATIIASRNQKVDWVISLAGTGVTGEEVVLKQSEELGLAMGSTTEEVENAARLNKKLYAVLKTTSDNLEAEAKMVSILTEELKKMEIADEIINERINNLKLTFGAATYTWFRYFLVTDPAQFWSKVKCPVLILNGDKDLQVNSTINPPAISKALISGGNNSGEVKIFPSMNHLFQVCETGLLGEYSIIEQTISPEVLSTMSLWIREKTGK